MSLNRGLITLITGAMLAPSGVWAAVQVEPGQDTVPGLALERIPSQVTLVHGERRTPLVLVGSGVRKQLMFKVYELAVYAQPGADWSRPYQALTGGRSVINLHLVFLRDTTGNKVRTAVEDGFRHAHGADHDFQEPLDTLLDELEQGMSAGQGLDLVWVPGEGLFTLIDGREKVSFPGDAFAKAILDVWVGPQCVSESLKKDMVRLAREKKR